ncbi:MAG: hypothetical protein CVU90_01955 [Firmicutes bacterium HGW-Firmicutes-15]|nr:MAG: hypothetical protein CVU90_01955 [Firmicutes bacterium HGW-Firmicutes-15]
MEYRPQFDKFVCTSQPLAGFLMQTGFKLYKLLPPLPGSDKNSFLFGNSPELINRINEYLTARGLWKFPDGLTPVK